MAAWRGVVGGVGWGGVALGWWGRVGWSGVGGDDLAMAAWRGVVGGEGVRVGVGGMGWGRVGWNGVDCDTWMAKHKLNSRNRSIYEMLKCGTDMLADGRVLGNGNYSVAAIALE
ncbi:hypothetical protein L1987_36322 [Smallanthus sonchifolius]|uniref:Uncharacterized protein n=1 Tax=Smallanthus sonchifolius TaxID=185202 RepID=A0ACB9HDA0_9ASTR|nr:hypothetical protein L1987_36322 [Smallanthus sonchifolius]